MRLVLICLLALHNPLSMAEDCSEKLSQCKLVIEDYKAQVSLLEQRSVILEKQRDEAVKKASNPEFPDYFWALVGGLAGSILVLYIKDK